MARRNDHSREEIQSMAIDAMRQMINREGMEGVSARKVAQKIGYTVGTLYQAFENIDDLILQANAYTLSELLSTIAQANQATTKPAQKILNIAISYFRYAKSHDKKWAAVFRHQLPAGYEIPDWYQARIDALFSNLEAALRELAPKRKPKSIQLASRSLWSSIHGVCMLHIGDKLFSQTFATPEEIITSIVKNYLNSWIKEV